jgi:nitrite reductase (NADH) large subunit
LFSAGVRSNTDLAAKSGIKVNKGIIVDEHLQTSAIDVYAAGDVAEFEGKVYGIIAAADEQARNAALNMVDSGERRIYKGTMPSNTLKIVGINLTSIGMVNPNGSRHEEVKKIDRAKGVYKKIVLDQAKIVGAIIIGNTRGASALKILIDQKTDVTKFKDLILEDNFDFKRVLK